MIDLQPTVNPLDVASPLPSEIVRSWPERNWGRRVVRRVLSDGTIRFCAKGILAETAGHNWSGDGRPTETVLNIYGIPRRVIYALEHVNDRDGKDAAADFLAARGF